MSSSACQIVDQFHPGWFQLCAVKMRDEIHGVSQHASVGPCARAPAGGCWLIHPNLGGGKQHPWAPVHLHTCKQRPWAPCNLHEGSHANARQGRHDTTKHALTTSPGDGKETTKAADLPTRTTQSTLGGARIKAQQHSAVTARVSLHALCKVIFFAFFLMQKLRFHRWSCLPTHACFAS
jgi:hypothetical protein